MFHLIYLHDLLISFYWKVSIPYIKGKDEQLEFAMQIQYLDISVFTEQQIDLERLSGNGS